MNKGNKKLWAGFAHTWKFVTAPSRPCDDQLRITEKILKKIKRRNGKKASALVLGSTPEFRDICIKLGFRTVSCDVNPLMQKAMTSMMKYRRSSKNMTKIGNWIEIDLPSKSFDIILGDLSLNQMSQKGDLAKLLKNISRLLKSDGILLTREVVRLDKKPLVYGKKWKELLFQYKKRKINAYELYSFIKYQSDTAKFSNSPSLIDWIPAIRKLEKIAEKTKDNKFIFDYTDFITMVHGGKSKKMLIYLKDDLESKLNKNFKLLAIEQCKQYKTCYFTPLFLAKKLN